MTLLGFMKKVAAALAADRRDESASAKPRSEPEATLDSLASTRSNRHVSDSAVKVAAGEVASALRVLRRAEVSVRHLKQSHRPRHDVMHEAERHFADGLPFALVPVLGADVITEDNPIHRQASRDGKFEGVAFDFAGDGTEDGEAGLFVVAGMAENDAGAASGLLAACLRIENQPADGAQLWNWSFALHGGRTSRPISAPHSVAGWRFSGVT